MPVDAQQNPTASPLTLVMTARSDADYAALEKMITDLQATDAGENRVRQVLNKIGTVHFARFVLMPPRQLAVITVFDGPLEDYLRDFAEEIGFVFNGILGRVEGAPPLPVEDHLSEFVSFVRQYDRGCVGPLYSAYPGRGVGEILVALRAADTADTP